MAKIRSDAHLYLTETGAAMPDPVPVALSSANPSIITFTPPIDGLVDGSMVVFSDTGLASLDGFGYRLRSPAVDGATATVEGLDMTALTEDIASKGTVHAITEVTDDDGLLLHACVATVTVAGQAPDSINLDDMCSATTVLGAPKPPTFQFTGWVDQESVGFSNLVQASLESPKQERWLLIDYGAEGGYIFGPVEIGEMSITAGVNAGLAYSGSGVFKEVPTYSWAL